jgi:hypothetical protein
VTGVLVAFLWSATITVVVWTLLVLYLYLLAR